jgi:hypothetical protein
VQPVVTQFNIEVARCAECGQRAQARHPEQTSDALGAAAVQPVLARDWATGAGAGSGAETRFGRALPQGHRDSGARVGSEGLARHLGAG